MDSAQDSRQLARARQEDLVVQEMPDEVLVYDLRQHKAHCLNRTAALIWQHCDGQTTVPEMAQRLQREAGPAVDEDVVRYGLDKLGRADLLSGTGGPLLAGGVSRRQMLRRVGSLALVPAVMSLAAPTAAQAQSVVSANQKIAVGQCQNRSNPNECVDACCTGQPQGEPQRLCGTSSCNGLLCVPVDAASPCSAQQKP